MSKSFNLEAFKAGQKACLIEGKWFRYGFTTSEGRICVEYEAALPLCDKVQVYHLETLKKAHMVSRHQSLIDAYNPDDTWQFSIETYDKWFDIEGKPEWEENREFRLHPNNDLIKAFKSGKEIVATNTDGNEVPLDCLKDLLNPHKDWDDLRIKTEPEFEYPIYKQSKYSGLVVEFTDLETGRVLYEGYELGYVQDCWISHTDSYWKDWTPPINTEFEYPIYKQSEHGLVVKFNSMNSGEVIATKASMWDIGEISSDWEKHTNSDVWQDWTLPVITAQFPESPFQLTCGDKLEVRQWLKSNGYKWGSDDDLMGYKLDIPRLNVYPNKKLVVYGYIDDDITVFDPFNQPQPEPTIHCLAYDASLDPNPKLWGAPVISEKQLAVKRGWKIIQEWEA